MEPKPDIPKLPDMVMCGDHPSFTKTELNAKEDDKELMPLSYPTFTPAGNLFTRPLTSTDGFTAPSESRNGMCDRGERRERAASQHMLRQDAHGARRRVLDAARSDAAPDNGALVQAALGSFRWPPYLLAVWVLVLVLTHALHCLVSCVEGALPRLKKLCQYFRTWAEDTWRSELDAKRLFPVMLALITGLLYGFYFALYVLYSIALWSIEPLCTATEPRPSAQEGMETKVTDYVEEVTKSDASLKQ